MPGIAVPFAAVLAAALLTTCGGEGSDDAASLGRTGYRLTVSDVDADTLGIEAQFGPAVTPAAGSMLLMCRTAHATLDRGFALFAVHRDSLGAPPVIVDLYHEAPAGWTIASATSMAWFGDSAAGAAEHVVMDARSIAESCTALEVSDRELFVDNVREPLPESPAAGHLSASRFRACPEVDSICTLTWLPAVAGTPARLCIAGRGSAVITEADGTLHHTVPFALRGSGIVPFDADGDGTLEFMNRGGGWGDVGVMEADGRLRWKFPDARSGAPDTMAAGDLDRDGVTDFVVGMNGSGGVYVLDARGQVKEHWAGGNVFSVEVADADGDGSPEILQTGSAADSGAITVCDGKGRELRSLAPGFSVFRLFRAPDGAPRLAEIVGGEVLLADLQGVVVERHAVSSSGHRDVELAWVAFEPARPPWLAVARTIGAASGHAEFYVFDAEGRLVQHEELPSSSAALAVLPADASGRQSLLVGAGNDVTRWQFVP